MWDDNDKQGFINANSRGVGQIYNDTCYTEIVNYASDLSNTTFLEIGTWNGMGSTRAFVEGLKNRTDNYIFYSLECNKDKSAYAAELYKDYKNILILNEVVWNTEPSNFYTIFPQCKDNELFNKWNTIDIINMKKCNVFLERKDLPEMFDVVLLDGGEFTTYYEFQLLKDRSKIIILDDINTDKCKLIVKEIESAPELWKIIKKDTTSRNGFMIAASKRTIT